MCTLFAKVEARWNSWSSAQRSLIQIFPYGGYAPELGFSQHPGGWNVENNLLPWPHSGESMTHGI